MPQRTEQIRPEVSSAYAYSPKWEIWVNGLVWEAVQRCVQAYSLMQATEAYVQGVPLSKITVPDDLFVRRVLVLYKLLHRIQRPDPQYEKMAETTEKMLHGRDGVNWIWAMDLFEEIMAYLHRTGHLRFKPPLDPAD